MPKSKLFNNKKYVLLKKFQYRHEAIHWKKWLEHRGKIIKVIKMKSGWEVYYR